MRLFLDQALQVVQVLDGDSNNPRKADTIIIAISSLCVVALVLSSTGRHILSIMSLRL